MFRQDSPEISGLSLGGCRFCDCACALCSVFHHVEQIKNVVYTPKKVGHIAMDLFSEGIIDKDFYIKSWNKVFAHFDIYVNTHFEGPDYVCSENEIEILKLEKPGYSHFVPGDGKSHYSWDSLGRRNAQKDYVVTEKRVFTLL